MVAPDHHTEDLLRDLAVKAAHVRKDIVQTVYDAGSGHPGGSLSSTDILTCLYFHHLRHNPKDPRWADRDRFVMSKGQASPLMYSILARSGYIAIDLLKTFRKANSLLQGHVEMKVPGVEFTTGSLGQGLSGAIGMALAARLDKKDYRTYCLLGDGETQEGQIWEAAMSASHYKLDNLCAILDRNGLQIDGPTEQIMSLGEVAKRWRSFGWHVIEIDGHDRDEILRALHEAEQTKNQPTIIVAKTVKGKGVSFMEGSLSFHGRPPNKDEYVKAMQELDEMIQKAETSMGVN
ncbi:MAG: transketolase [Euryarchaeota archaeon]|nr:transketolase [Euryarchaeota archaeon]